MIKNFPKSRISVIDIYEPFENGLKDAISFANKHNISLNTSDGQKIILNFCLKSIDEFYKKQTSMFPKVACIGTKPKTKRIEYFVANHFQTVMKYFPIPYCGIVDLSSPDLECIAQRSLEQEKTQRKFKKMVSKMKMTW